jgi:hypothetical protein
VGANPAGPLADSLGLQGARHQLGSLNTMAGSLWGKAHRMEYAFKRSRPIGMAPSQLGAFITRRNISEHSMPRAARALSLTFGQCHCTASTHPARPVSAA